MLFMLSRPVYLLCAAFVSVGQAQTLSLLHWNVAGNGTTDWSTNAPQIQAIGRHMLYLRPDVVAFNEVPRTNLWQMANFVVAYLPGYFLATNSGTDGFLRSAIASRHSIIRSQKWLENASLAPWGYTNTTHTYTRDLFEAEIAVPGWAQHLHVFTTHLKATDNTPATDFTNSVKRRAAEASAVSNFFVNTFLPVNGQRPYVLVGDLNEDIAKPQTVGGNSISGNPIQRLTAASTGLRLTTPLNPFTAGSNTHSIRASLSSRLDYVLPGALLFSNIATSQVFRTDRLSPLPAGLNLDDSETASDHLPVLMTFFNPYDPAPRITSVTPSNQFLYLTWTSVTGRTYRVEASTNLVNWTAAGANLFAATTNQFWSTQRNVTRQFLRVRRLP